MASASSARLASRAARSSPRSSPGTARVPAQPSPRARAADSGVPCGGRRVRRSRTPRTVASGPQPEVVFSLFRNPSAPFALSCVRRNFALCYRAWVRLSPDGKGLFYGPWAPIQLS